MRSLKLAFLWSSALLILYGKLSDCQNAYDSGGSSGASSASSASSAASSSSSSSSSSSGSSWVPYPPAQPPVTNCISPEVPICSDLQPQDCCPDRCRCPFGYVRRSNDSVCVEYGQPSTQLPPPDGVQCPENEIPICSDQQHLRDCCPDRCRCPFGYVRRTTDGKCIEYAQQPASDDGVWCPDNEVPICTDDQNYVDCCPDRCRCPFGFVRRTTDGRCIKSRNSQQPPSADGGHCPENEIPICTDEEALQDCCPDRCRCPFGFVRLKDQGGKCVPDNIPTQPGQTTFPNEVAICGNGDTDCCPDRCKCPGGFVRLSAENGRCVKDCPANEVPICANGDQDCCPDQCRCPEPFIRQDGICRRRRQRNRNRPNCPKHEVPICTIGTADCCPDRCRCPDGFVRLVNDNGRCVRDSPGVQKDVDPPNCGPNEVPICAEGPGIPPGKYCCSDRCRCPQGFVRQNCNGPCVRP